MGKSDKRVVVVTGGAGLLGKEFIRAISGSGAIAVSADIKKAEGQSDSVEIDITSKASVIKAIDSIHKKYGRIDALVNNAYPRNNNYGRKFEDVTYEDFSENVSKHLGGYFLCSQVFSEYFMKQGHGNIISMASIYGVSAPKFEIYEWTDMTMPVEYAAIKSSVIHLTRYMAKYFKGKNIRFNSISPGGVMDNQPKDFIRKYSELSLSGKMLSASAITGTLLFLLSEDSAAINGQNIVVDEGWTL